MKTINAAWPETDEAKEINEVLDAGDTVEFREWLGKKMNEYKEDYRRYI